VQFKRYDLAIINRGFWPESQIIGEGLLRLSEKHSESGEKVVIITQSDSGLMDALIRENRAKNVVVSLCKARSNSASKVIMRVFDSIIFMCWVFFTLLKKKPKKVYISTDPPVVVPFIVFIYAKLFKASYVYHLQDIHPEAASIIIKVNPVIYRITKWMDSLVMKRASALITITDTMKKNILRRSKTMATIYIIDNPSAFSDFQVSEKKKGFVFSGNAGRLQRIPLLLNSIRDYRKQGGKLPFAFAGGGVFKNKIEELSKEVEDVTYYGILSAKDASSISSAYEWALLPIEDKVTEFAFPSKSSTYVVSGNKILSICGSNTSVSKWVVENNFGKNSIPNIQSIVNTFIAIERGEINIKNADRNIEKFSIDCFVEQISNVLSESC
jgi:hypothetical protein